MRRSIQFLLFIAVCLVIFLLLPLHARHKQQVSAREFQPHGAELRKLRVTDLCLTTEARYTRHLAMADRHAPFQAHPLALEHFPSGSLVLPDFSLRGKP
jgi:hypothetical protein